MTTETTGPGKESPAIPTLAIARGTLVSTDLERARETYAELLGLECARVAPDRLLVRGPEARALGARGERYWVLEVRKVDSVSHPQTMLNHWGLFADDEAAVDRAYGAAVANKARFALRRVQKPRAQHLTYSFYMEDADSNWWEIEYRPPAVTYERMKAMGDRFPQPTTGVRA